MENFKLLLSDVDVSEAATELKDNGLWDVWEFRQKAEGSAHHGTKCIPLYAPEVINYETIYNDLIAYESVFVHLLPKTMELFDEVMRGVEWTEIGRVMVVDLLPGEQIDRHKDEGAYSDFYDRMHVVITSEPGNLFMCGDEVIHMKPGEVWKFNHRIEHEVFNSSQASRLHLIIDYTGA